MTSFFDGWITASTNWVALSLLHLGWIGFVVLLVGLAGNRMARQHTASVRYGWNFVVLIALAMMIPVSVGIAMAQQGSLQQAAVESRAIDLTEAAHDPSQLDDSRQSDHTDSEQTSETGDQHQPANSSGRGQDASDTERIQVTTIAGIPVFTSEPREQNSVSNAGIASRSPEPSANSRAIANWISGLYLAGLAFMTMRLSVALLGGLRLRRASIRLEDSAVRDLIEREQQRIGLRRLPLVSTCGRLGVPVVMGTLRPTLLLPASMITGLSPSQLSDVIAHELAHLRRLDHLAVLIQRVVETLLFFHPAVWILSRRVSIEREASCDERVIASGRDRIAYAQTLLSVAEMEWSRRFAVVAQTQLAMTGPAPSRLRERIGRILGGNSQHLVVLSRFDLVGALTVCLMMIALMIGLRASPPVAVSGPDSDAAASADESTNETDSAEASVSQDEGPMRVEEILASKIDLEIERAAIITALSQLEQASGLEITLSMREFRANGITSNHPVSVSATDEPVDQVLQKILDQVHLDFEVTADGVRIPARPQEPTDDVAADPDGSGDTPEQDDTKRNRVVDARGVPIAGATIELRPYTIEESEAFATTTTDDEGYFDYPEDTPESEYFRLVVSAEGYVESRSIGNYFVHVKRDGEWVPDVIQLDHEVTIRGIVIGGDGDPLPGVELAFDFISRTSATINADRFESDENGEFELTGLPTGELFVRYERRGDEFASDENPARMYIAHVHAGDTTREVNNVTLDLSRATCKVTGQVVDADGRGVDGVSIRVAYAFSSRRLDHAIETTTGVNGRFEIDGLPPHAFEISASTRGVGMGERQVVQLRPGETTNVRIDPFTDGTPPPAERMVEPEWGPVHESTQAALIVEPQQDEYQVGDVVDIGVLVRNTGDEAIEFDDTWSFNRLHITSETGERHSFDYRSFTGIPWTEKYRLQPGHEVLLKGRFNIQFSRPDDTGRGGAMFRATLAPDAEYQLRISMGDGFDNRDPLEVRRGQPISGVTTIRLVEQD